MRTNCGTTTRVKFVALLLVVALVLTVLVFLSSNSPKVAVVTAPTTGTKTIFGQVVFPGQTTLPAETIAYCKANGWGVELSLPGNDAVSYFTETSKATWYAGVIQSITNHDIPVWLEIEGLVYYGNATVATTPAEYQSQYGACLAIYEKLGPLFKGYSFEGGYDNAIIWLKEHSQKKLLAHWLPGYYQEYNTGVPNYTPTNVPEWGTHNMTWRVNQFDEIVWETYQVDWVQSAVHFKNWLDTVAPSKPFGVLTGWEADGGYWWNPNTHNYSPWYANPFGVLTGLERPSELLTGAQQQALLTKWLTWLKGQIGPFAGIVCDPGGQSVTVPCMYLDSLNLTNGTSTRISSATATPTPAAP